MALNKKMQLEFSSAISNLTESNSSFDCGNLRIAYTGKNRNGSFISKASFESAIPSMYGCPVVANYMREIDEIGSHDGEIVETPDGDLKYVNITQPVGFVPPGAKYWWETLEDDGVIHQYLNTEVILWKRQEAYDKIKENGITRHSMEISVIDGEMQDDYYQINEFEFTAFCLLGTAEPCFESSALFTFNKNEMQDQLNEMFKEFKLAFSSNLTEKEEHPEMILQELLDKYNLTVEDLDFEYENLSDEELTAKFAELYDAKKDEEPDEEPEEDPEDEPEEDIEEPSEEDDDEDDKTKKFALESILRGNLCKTIYDKEVVEDAWGSYPRYFMWDYDADLHEVYFQDALDDWNLYGAPYEEDGDDVVIDFEAKKRKKLAVVDYVEGEASMSHVDTYAAFIQRYENTCNALNERIAEYEAKNHQMEANKLFEEFEEQLSDSEEFQALKSSVADYSIEELEEKLYSIVGRQQFEHNNNSKAPAIPALDRDEHNNDPYGTLFNFLKH